MIISIGYQDLLDDCRRAGLVDGTELTPGQLRRWACDAGIIPIVLGGTSAPLDVGREQRLVTPDIRHAMHVRDQGCVFPGCDRAPADCDAHHIIPWQHDGPTALQNLVLLCGQHHNLCEPRNDPEYLRWQIRIGPDSIPEVIPPRHVDRKRRPRRHQRFRPPDG